MPVSARCAHFVCPPPNPLFDRPPSFHPTLPSTANEYSKTSILIEKLRLLHFCILCTWHRCHPASVIHFYNGWSYGGHALTGGEKVKSPFYFSARRYNSVNERLNVRAPAHRGRQNDFLDFLSFIFVVVDYRKTAKFETSSEID